MKVFLSWSGERSRRVAAALYNWLPLVINALDPWLSTEDVNAGTRWNLEISRSLHESKVGIFCLTPENLDSTWLAFEAGAIAKDPENSFACTYLLGLKPTQVKWPLAQFQAKTATKGNTLELLKTINLAANDAAPLLKPEHLDKAFKKWWPDLEEELKALPTVTVAEPELPPSEQMIAEILTTLRRQERLTQNRPISRTDSVPLTFLEYSRLKEMAKEAIRLLDPKFQVSLVRIRTNSSDAPAMEFRDSLGRMSRIRADEKTTVESVKHFLMRWLTRPDVETA